MGGIIGAKANTSLIKLLLISQSKSMKSSKFKIQNSTRHRSLQSGLQMRWNKFDEFARTNRAHLSYTAHITKLSPVGGEGPPYQYGVWIKAMVRVVVIVRVVPAAERLITGVKIPLLQYSYVRRALLVAIWSWLADKWKSLPLTISEMSYKALCKRPFDRWSKLLWTWLSAFAVRQIG